MRRLETRERILVSAVLLTISVSFVKLWYMEKSKVLTEKTQALVMLESEIKTTSAILASQEARLPSSLKPDQHNFQEETLGRDTRFAQLLQELTAKSAEREISVQRIVVESEGQAVGAQEMLAKSKQVLVGSESNLGDWKKVAFRLEAEGSFLSVASLLEDLENSKYLTAVNGFEISRVTPDLRRCVAKVQIESYFPQEVK